MLCGKPGHEAKLTDLPVKYALCSLLDSEGLAMATSALSSEAEKANAVGHLRSLDRSSRVDLMCELFDLCPHREQIEILARLPGFLLRDFIGLLPPELVEKILCYLHGQDVFTCMLVSRAWYRAITHCEQFWRTYCSRIGLTNRMITEGRSKYSSLRDLAIVGQKVLKRIKHAMPKFGVYIPGAPETGTTLTVRPAEPTRHGYFVGHEFHSRRGQEPSKYVLSIQKLHDHENVTELMELTAVEVSSHFVILWCSSFTGGVTIYGSTGEWIHCTFDWEDSAAVGQCEGNIHSSLVGRFQDNIYSLAYYEIGSCPKCSMIVVIPRTPRDGSLWDVEVVRLIAGAHRPEKFRCVFPFLPDDSLIGNVFFQARDVVLLPTSSSTCDRHGFCMDHKALFQFGGGLVLCSLSLHRGTVSLNQLRTHCPNGSVSSYATAAALGQKLCISEDWQLAAYFLQGILYIWNLETGEEHQLVNHRFPKKGYCLGVGHFFSMVFGEGTIRVVCSETGVLALTHQLSYTGENPVYSPRHQEWLNTLEFPRRKLELAVTIPEWQSAGEITFSAPDLRYNL